MSEEKNRSAATVGVRLVKAANPPAPAPVAKSDKMTNIPPESESNAGTWLEHPINFDGLEIMVSNSTIVPQCIQAYKNNVTGFGIEIDYRDEFKQWDEDEHPELVADRIERYARLVGRERGANVGACTQPCRWGWALVEESQPDVRRMPVEYDGSWSYILSSNDLCMLDHLGDLAQAGVSAIKIEGRAKGAYYTACVTNAYRHVLDGEPASAWMGELDAVSHRPYSTGFFYGNPTQNPGRVEYARDRLMVATVEKCAPLGGGRGYSCEVRCRNRATFGSILQVLSATEPIRECSLEAADHWDEATGSWEPVSQMNRAMDLYRVELPFAVEPLDIPACRGVPGLHHAGRAVLPAVVAAEHVARAGLAHVELAQLALALDVGKIELVDGSCLCAGPVALVAPREGLLHDGDALFSRGVLDELALVHDSPSLRFWLLGRVSLVGRYAARRSVRARTAASCSSIPLRSMPASSFRACVARPVPPERAGSFRLTATMPADTSARARPARTGSMLALSPRMRAESPAPKTGFMKPKTVTRETGFAESSIDQSE